MTDWNQDTAYQTNPQWNAGDFNRTDLWDDHQLRNLSAFTSLKKMVLILSSKKNGSYVVAKKSGKTILETILSFYCTCLYNFSKINHISFQASQSTNLKPYYSPFSGNPSCSTKPWWKERWELSKIKYETRLFPERQYRAVTQSFTHILKTLFFNAKNLYKDQCCRWFVSSLAILRWAPSPMSTVQVGIATSSIDGCCMLFQMSKRRVYSMEI